MKVSHTSQEKKSTKCFVFREKLLILKTEKGSWLFVCHYLTELNITVYFCTKLEKFRQTKCIIYRENPKF